jgi:hypothetical protein
MLFPPSGFNIGDVANYCRPGFERHGAQVEIVEGYQLHQVVGEQAPSIPEYCWGYLVRELGGQPWFCPAYALRGPDDSIRHVTLVHSATVGI